MVIAFVAFLVLENDNWDSKFFYAVFMVWMGVCLMAWDIIDFVYLFRDKVQPDDDPEKGATSFPIGVGLLVIGLILLLL